MNTFKSVIVIPLLCLTGMALHAQSIVQTIPVGAGIYEIVYNPSDKAVYVAATGSRNNPQGYVYKLNAHQDKIVIADSIYFGEHSPFGLGLNTKTQMLYTSNTRSNAVSAADLQAKKVIATISNNKDKSHTREVIVDENANLIYVSDVDKNSSIWIIDGKTNQYTGSIENTGNVTTGMALDQKNNQLFVTNMGSNEIAVIDLLSKKVSRSFSSGGEGSVNLVLDDTNRRLYVTNQKSGSVTILDPDKGILIDSIKTGEGALGIGLYKKKQLLIITNRQSGQTSIVDIAGKKVISQLKTGTFPNSVAVNQEDGIAYITNKAKGGRAQEGQPAPPKDENGDTVSVIKL